MVTERNCIKLKNAYCKNIIGGVKDLKPWEGSSKAEACQNRCNKGKLLTRGGEYQKLDYNCGGSFIYKKNGKSRCYHCNNKGEIRLSSATNNLQLCKTAYTNYIKNYHPEGDEKITPDKCNWGMLSDDYKSQYTLKTSCTWNDLSEAKKTSAKEILKEDGFISRPNCRYEDLSIAERSNCKRSDLPCTRGNWRMGNSNFSCGRNSIPKNQKCPRFIDGKKAYCHVDGKCYDSVQGAGAQKLYHSDEYMCKQIHPGCEGKNKCKENGDSII